MPYLTVPEETEDYMDPSADPDPDYVPQPLGDETANGPNAAAAPPNQYTTFTDVIRRWRDEGALTRVPSGFGELDRLCGGGMLIPRRIVVVGAPGAGKTYLETVVAHRLVTTFGEHGFCVGMLAVDEDDADLTVRFAQMVGFTQAHCEERSEQTLDDLDAALRDHRIRFYDHTWTIEDAAADVAAWAGAEDLRGVLCGDSLHTIHSARSANALTPREYVEGNIAALRLAYDQHHLTIIITAEMNRAGYQRHASALEANPLASSAESRAAEYFAQTLVSLRTPKDHPNIVHAVVAKNRGARRGEFWLELDHQAHGVREVPDPDASPEAVVAKHEKVRAANQGEVLADAKRLADIVRTHPGINERDLRAEVRAQGLRWGRDKLDAAKRALSRGHDGVRLVDRDPNKRACAWHVEPLETEPDWRNA
jgi:KaiC/GvpD/RAD55 family RecA-like ATPase